MDQSSSIKTWAEDDRPREKMLLKGKNALSDAELLAILIRSGTVTKSALDVAQEILKSCNNDLSQLSKLSIHELKKFSGVGVVKAITLCAAIELGRRRQRYTDGEKVKITSSNVAYDYLKPDFLDLYHEEFYVLYLNRGNVVISKKQLSIGGVAGTVADGKLIFKTALELNACGIILAHNHPSGRTQPSEQDKRLTTQLKSFGKLIEIEVLDHLIITENSYYSFADEGLM